MLALKLFLLQSLICGVTLAGRRWGPAVAGWLSGLVAVLSFIIAYAQTAKRRSWVVSVLIGWLAYFVAVLVLLALQPPLSVSAFVDVAALWYTPRLLPRVAAPAFVPKLHYSEILVRMFAGVALLLLLLLLLTYFASGLGPHLSGLLAMFPTLGTVLAAFSHRHAGPESAIHLMRG